MRSTASDGPSRHEVRREVGKLVGVFSLTVYGDPVPQGSKRIGRTARGSGRPILLDDNDAKLRPWRLAVQKTARLRMANRAPFAEPVALLVTFTVARPKSAPKRRRFPAVRPDLSKLVRAVEDSLTDAGVWLDDSLVVAFTASKRYVGDSQALDRPGVELEVWPL